MIRSLLFSEKLQFGHGGEAVEITPDTGQT